MNCHSTISFIYDHFCHNDEKFAYLRDLYEDYTGICWFACFVMCYQAYNRKISQEEAIAAVCRASTDLDSETEQRIFSMIINKYPAARNLAEKNYFRILDENRSGHNNALAVEYPEIYLDYVNLILEERKMGISLESVELVGNTEPEALFEKIKNTIFGIRIPIIAFKIEENDEAKTTDGHMVMVGGANELEITISDPNEIKPVHISYKFIVDNFHTGIPYGNGKIIFDNESVLFIFKMAR